MNHHLMGSMHDRMEQSSLRPKLEPSAMRENTTMNPLKADWVLNPHLLAHLLPFFSRECWSSFWSSRFAILQGNPWNPDFSFLVKTCVFLFISKKGNRMDYVHPLLPKHNQWENLFLNFIQTNTQKRVEKGLPDVCTSPYFQYRTTSRLKRSIKVNILIPTCTGNYLDRIVLENDNGKTLLKEYDGWTLLTVEIFYRFP